MKNVIVTGGAGFIGSSLCKKLTQHGYAPIIIDDLSTGHEKLAQYGELIQDDCGSYAKMVDVFKHYKPLAVFHIAGSKSVAESVSDPYTYYDNNVTKTNALLKATVDCEIKHFIFSSSAAIFGIPEADYVMEDHPALPINPYGYSKLMVEHMLQGYQQSHGLVFSALRYFNVVGADPDLELGEICDNPNNIFPLILQVIEGVREKFTIFGDDYDTKDGTGVRDYIHVSDLADAHLKAFEKQLETNQSIKVNLGNGQGSSVKEVVQVFKAISGKDFAVEIGERRQGDPGIVMADNQLASTYLKWKPQYTDLKQQARHAYQWHFNQ